MNRKHFYIELTIIMLYHFPFAVAILEQDVMIYMLGFIFTILPMGIFQLIHAYQISQKYTYIAWLDKHLKTYFTYSIYFFIGLPLAFLSNHEYIILSYVLLIPEILMFYLLWITYKASNSLVE